MYDGCFNRNYTLMYAYTACCSLLGKSDLPSANVRSGEKIYKDIRTMILHNQC